MADSTFIDLTPTWAQIAPTIALILTDGGYQGQEEIKPELWRMAELADERNAMCKAIVAARDLLAAAPQCDAVDRAKAALDAVLHGESGV